MTIRNSVLALLSREPVHGYGLKTGIEESTLGLWPINVGQIYTTLARLERDGLVESAAAEDDDLADETSRDDSGARNRNLYRITEAGRAALRGWYRTPVDCRATRDELVIKVLVAVATGDPEVQTVLDEQRAATMRELQEHTRAKLETDGNDLAALLLLDALILRGEAEVRWLDLCEQRLGRAAETGRRR